LIWQLKVSSRGEAFVEVRLTEPTGVNVKTVGPPVMFHVEPAQPGVPASPVPVALSENTPDSTVSVVLVIPMVPTFSGAVELLTMDSEDATPVAPTVTAPPPVGMLGPMLIAVPARTVGTTTIIVLATKIIATRAVRARLKGPIRAILRCSSSLMMSGPGEPNLGDAETGMGASTWAVLAG
jgi:hypothetical protein